MIEQLNKKYSLFLSLIVGFVVSILFSPLIFPDSDGYIKYDSLRSLGYPLFIFILGKNLKLVVFIQAFLSILSCIYFSKQIKIFFEFHKLTTLFFFVLISLIAVKISINILPGSLCFTLYLFSLSYALKSYKKNEIKDYLISSLFLLIAILIRPQLFFAITHLVIIGLYLAYKNKKNLIFLISVLAVIFISPNKLNKFTNLKFNNVEVSISDTWNQLLIFPLFLSDISLLDHFENEVSKDLFVLSLRCVEQKNLTKIKTMQLNQNWIYVLESNSFTVKNCTNLAVSNKFPNYTHEMREKISKELYFDFLKAHLSKNKFLFLTDLIKKYSFAFINIFYFFIFLIFCLVLLIFQMYRYNIKLFFFNIFILNHLSNIFIIGLGAPLLLRYRFYTEVILIILILSILLEFFATKNVKKSKM